MTPFWIGAGLLLSFALMMLAVPLAQARRDRAQVSARAENLRAHRQHLEELEAQRVRGDLADAEAQTLREELEYSLLLDAGEAVAPASGNSRVPGWMLYALLAVSLMVSATLLYQQLGAAQDWQLARHLDAVVAAPDAGTRARRLEDLVAGLEQREAGARGTTELFLLARSRMELGRYAGAVQAYATLVDQNPDEARLLAEYAQARFAASNRVLGPETADILRRVLVLEPDNQTALGMLGLGMFNHGNYAAAVRYWERALASAEDPAGQHALRSGIARARAEMGLPGQEPASATAGPQVQVRVALDAGVGPAPGGQAAVFVFARRVSGPRMPLAAARLSPAEMPKSVVLDDRHAMMEGMNLSSAGDEVEIQARLTYSGQPLPQSGDWESAPVRVSLKTPGASVQLTIDRQLP